MTKYKTVPKWYMKTWGFKKVRNKPYYRASPTRACSRCKKLNLPCVVDPLTILDEDGVFARSACKGCKVADEWCTAPKKYTDREIVSFHRQREEATERHHRWLLKTRKRQQFDAHKELKRKAKNKRVSFSRGVTIVDDVDSDKESDSEAPEKKRPKTKQSEDGAAATFLPTPVDQLATSFTVLNTSLDLMKTEISGLKRTLEKLASDFDFKKIDDEEQFGRIIDEKAGVKNLVRKKTDAILEALDKKFETFLEALDKKLDKMDKANNKKRDKKWEELDDYLAAQFDDVHESIEKKFESLMHAASQNIHEAVKTILESNKATGRVRFPFEQVAAASTPKAFREKSPAMSYIRASAPTPATVRKRVDPNRIDGDKGFKFNFVSDGDEGVSSSDDAQEALPTTTVKKAARKKTMLPSESDDEMPPPARTSQSTKGASTKKRNINTLLGIDSEDESSSSRPSSGSSSSSLDSVSGSGSNPDSDSVSDDTGSESDDSSDNDDEDKSSAGSIHTGSSHMNNSVKDSDPEYLQDELMDEDEVAEPTSAEAKATVVDGQIESTASLVDDHTESAATNVPMGMGPAPLRGGGGLEDEPVSRAALDPNTPELAEVDKASTKPGPTADLVGTPKLGTPKLDASKPGTPKLDTPKNGTPMLGTLALPVDNTTKPVVDYSLEEELLNNPKGYRRAKKAHRNKTADSSSPNAGTSAQNAGSQDEKGKGKEVENEKPGAQEEQKVEQKGSLQMFL